METKLMRSVNNQLNDIEIILIDNTTGVYSSAVNALEYGISRSTTDIYIFAHQDVYIKEKDGLERFARIIQEGRDGDVFGVAGSIECVRQNIGLFTSGDVFVDSLKECDWNLKKVSCLDEFMFGMKKVTYYQHPFNGNLCDNWHLYCAEMCLHARKNGSSIWIAPIQVHHFSNGNITNEYMSCLMRIAQEYRGDFKYIWTTAYKVRSNRLYINVLVAAWRLNRWIKKTLSSISIR
ncbi:MAG: hypothetical protein IKO16_05960 [Lachnospiraceae bacterium]|nr:hypothetical protein [Lachnospiraceae bacterium]